MSEYVVRQGDQYSIPFPIILENYILSTDDIDNVEITIGQITKTYKKGQIDFDEGLYYFLFPLTETETFQLQAGSLLPSQVRVKLKNVAQETNNFVCSFDGPDIRVIESMSKESI